MEQWQAVNLWRTLSHTPVDEDNRITEWVWHFPAGTFIEEIWHYIEEECPGVSIAEWQGIA